MFCLHLPVVHAVRDDAGTALALTPQCLPRAYYLGCTHLSMTTHARTETIVSILLHVAHQALRLSLQDIPHAAASQSLPRRYSHLRQSFNRIWGDTARTETRLDTDHLPISGGHVKTRQSRYR